MAVQMLEGTCPHCGNTLQIPENLLEFSCLYCGKRMQRNELVPPRVKAETEDALAYVHSRILACVEDEEALRDGIRKSAYERVFAEYEAKHRETFCQMDDACRAEPERQTEILTQCVCDFLSQLENRWAAGKKMQAENDKVVVALYMVPAIRHLKLSCSEQFCSLLHAEWMKRYPKNPFYVGDYETLVGGFRKKYLGLCFITTAVCEQEGKPDDCEELTAFRNFRDGYLQSCPDGPALIKAYYEIASAVVTMIGVCEHAETAYGEIRSRWLDACYRDLQQGNPEACKARYIDMVRTMEAKYLN